MKIGILTFYNTLNYGAFLQMYSLYSYLVKSGYEVEVIRYDCKAVVKREEIKKFFDNKTLKDTIKWLLTFRSRKIKYEKFIKSSDEIKFSALKYNSKDVSKLENIYDYIIVGSDQIWNNNLTENDDTYFLNNINCHGKLSYAASFGLNKLDENYSKKIKDYLNAFIEISVREQKAVDILKSLGIDSKLVLDPIFLFNKTEWNYIIRKQIQVKRKKYILLYLMTNTEHLIEFARKLAENNDLELINANPSLRDFGKYRVKNVPALSPFEWVKLINDAEFIITNSFHGLAFSINLNKEFYTAIENLEQNTSSRLENLLTLTGLEYRNILSDNFIAGSTIDYNKVNIILDEKRELSKKFLNDNLLKAEKQCE